MIADDCFHYRTTIVVVTSRLTIATTIQKMVRGISSIFGPQDEFQIWNGGNIHGSCPHFDQFETWVMVMVVAPITN